MMTRPAHTRPSVWFIAAGVLSAATAAIHVFAGAPEVMYPLLAAELPLVVKGVADVLWHHVTGLLLLATGASLWAAWQRPWRLPVLILIGGQYLLIAVLFVGFGLAWFGSVWPMPQWVLFSLMLVLMGVGSRQP
jgi:hypothetical protein